jgi:periplasmic divalent cation tolerance protein
MAMQLALVMTTCETVDQAERLGRLLVEERLVACVAIGPGQRSIFPWEGRIAVEDEVPLMIKTAPERVDQLKQAIEAHHPYDVPECLVLSIDDGLDAYAAWARDWLRVES